MKKIKNLFIVNLFLITCVLAQDNYSLSFDGSDDYANLILDTALVAEGEAIANPREFTQRLSDLMQKALG